MRSLLPIPVFLNDSSYQHAGIQVALSKIWQVCEFSKMSVREVTITMLLEKEVSALLTR